MGIEISFYILLAGNSTFGNQYITSLYWAATTSASVGYGDVYAHTTTEVSTSVIRCSKFTTCKMKENLRNSFISSSQLGHIAKLVVMQ